MAQVPLTVPHKYYCAKENNQYQVYMNLYCKTWIEKTNKIPSNKNTLINQGNELHAAAQRCYIQKKKAGLIVSIAGKKGRRRIVDNLPSVVQEAVQGSSDVSAHERRRDYSITAHLGVAQLVRVVNENLANQGIKLSRSTIRRACMPCHRRRRFAKLHYPTTNIKLSKPQNSSNLIHKDSHYARALAKFIRNFAYDLGNEALFLSLDKKANIPLHGQAVSKQVKLLSVVNQSIDLPDHSFRTAHKETIGLNVVLECGLKKENRNVSIVNRRVFVILRSNFTNPTTKFENIIDVSNAIEKLKDKSGQVPPVLILYSDNHSEVAPQNRFNQMYGYFIFKKFELDSLVWCSFSPNDSKFNMVEHSMSLINYALKGITDLIPSGVTHEDDGFEDKANKAMDKVDKVLNNYTFNGKTLESSYVPCSTNEELQLELEYLPKKEDLEKFFGNKKMKSSEKENILELLSKMHKHSEEGNGTYQFCIRKCNDISCCPPKRASKYWNLLQDFDGFIPSPVLREDGHYLGYSERLADKAVKLDEGKPSGKIDSCTKCKRLLHSAVDAKMHYLCLHSKQKEVEEMEIFTPPKERNSYSTNKTSIEGRSQSHLFSQIGQGFQLPSRKAKNKRKLISPMLESP